MKPFWLKLASISFIVALLFQIVFGVIVPKMLIRQDDSYLKRWNDFYTIPVNADIVILGSSRVHRHFDPKEILKVTGMLTEDIAISGAHFNFVKSLYADYLRINKRPKILIVGIDFGGLTEDHTLPFPEFFYPQIHNSTFLKGANEYKYFRLKQCLGYFYYKERYFDIIENPDHMQHTHGYLPRNINWGDEKAVGDNQGNKPFFYSFSLSAVDSIMAFIHTQNQQGVKCFGVLAPQYAGIFKFEQNRDRLLTLIDSAARSRQVKVLNFIQSGYKLNFDRHYFYNNEHLNAKGASVFSKDFADSLNRIISDVKFQ